MQTQLPDYHQQRPGYSQQQPVFNQPPAYNQPGNRQHQPVHNQHQAVHNQHQPVHNQRYNQEPAGSRKEPGYSQQHPVSSRRPVGSRQPAPSRQPVSDQQARQETMSMPQLDPMDGLRPAMALVICLILCFFLPMIIMNIVFASGDSECLTQEITKFSIDIDLRTWLLVQAYVLLAIAVVCIFGAIAACISPIVGAVLGGLGLCMLLLYTLFSIAWIIVGAIMFWGELDPAGTCHTALNVYMWIILILGLLSICSPCCMICQGILSPF